MKLNPKIAKVPDDLKRHSFKKMRALLKKDLLRLEKQTSAEKPTSVILAAEFDYTDKPMNVGLVLFGAWRGTWKDYAKKTIAKEHPLGAIGQVYYGGIDADGQKVLHFGLAKGRAKAKVSKLEKGLKKLIPQATYNLIFSDMAESELDRLENKLDAMPDLPENFEDADPDDAGQIDLDRGQNARLLLQTNLKEISETWVLVRDQVVPRLRAKTPHELDADKVTDLLDLCEEWLELQAEAPAVARLLYMAKVRQVRKIKEQAETILPLLPKAEPRSAAPQSPPPAQTADNLAQTAGQTNTPAPTKIIKAPVGVGGGSKEDTIVVQTLLKAAGMDLGKFGPNKDGIDGDCGQTTIKAIRDFQTRKQLQNTGVVHPDSNTWKALNNQPYQTEVAPGTQSSTPTQPVGQPINTAHRALELGLEMAKETRYQAGHVYIPVKGKATGRQYKPGDKIEEADRKHYNPTWCNQFAYDLTDKVLGANSPFNYLPASKGWTNANALFRFMEQANGVLFDEIGRFEEAWQHINAGKIVYFVALGRQNSTQGSLGSGHVATGAPTPPAKMREHNKDKFGEVIQAGSKTGQYNILSVWGTGSIGNVKIYLSRFQEPLAQGQSQDPNLFLKVYKSIDKPVGLGHIVPTNQGPQVHVKTVQQLLVNAGQNLGTAGPFKNGVDGLASATGATVKAIENIQREMNAKGIATPVNGLVAMNDATWNYLYGKSQAIIEAPAPNPNAPAQTLQPSAIQFEYKGGAAKLSAPAETALREILAQAQEPKAAITATLRTATQQAQVMYLNLKATGPVYNRQMYKDKAAAGRVIDAYEAALAAGKTPNEIGAAMLQAIQAVGADKLSAHCVAANPAVDIHPSSILNKARFEQILKADARVAKVVCPPADTTYHIEFK